MLGLTLESGLTSLIIPVVAIGVIFGLRVIKLLASHQQTMARIVNDNAQGGNSAMQVDSLRREVDALRMIVQQLNTSVDHLRALQERSAVEPSISERVSQIGGSS